ncbi:MAG: C39 family peptidase [Bacteroidales bacterium]|nr:C39 family peptidase [Bacteroidales bacterium]
MKKIISTLLLYILIMPISAQVQLPVNIVDQEDDVNWCWAASISSIAQYYQKPSAALLDIVETARYLNPAKFGNIDCHSSFCPDCHQTNVMMNPYDGSISHILAEYGISNNPYGVYPVISKNDRHPLVKSEVKSEIDAGRPILATWQYYAGGGHAVVILGYDGDILTVMNPWNGGTISYIHYDSFYDDLTYRYWYGTAQLTTDPPPCTLTPYITGPTNVCTSEYTFTVNNLCPGSTITWSVVSGLLQFVSSSANTAVFRGLAGTSGLGQIQAAVTLPSGSVTNVTYSVWVGTPAISNVTGPRYNLVGASSAYYAIVDASECVTSYNYSLIPGTFNNYVYPHGNHCTIQWNTAGEYVLQVNAVNSEYGAGSTFYYPVTVGGYLLLSPNPTTDNVQVTVLQSQSISEDVSVNPTVTTESTSEKKATYNVSVLNTFGTVFYSSKKT